MNLFKNKKKVIVALIWVAIFVGSLYIYFFNKDLLSSKFLKIFGSSAILGYSIFFIFSCLRGFTLIPVTYFIFLGVLFLKPWPLYIITLIGVTVSSLSVYYFSEYLNLDEYFENNHKKDIEKIKSVLSKNELPIVITWSFMPFLPTDLMCYVCGTLEVDVKKFILGVLIGEGIMCAVYIFFGKEILSLIHL